MTPEELTGRSRSHLAEVAGIGLLHRHVVAPFAAMRRAARAAGFDLVPASAFRDFDRQLAIWNRKYAALDTPAAERIEAILRWSALPGLSRHHWGTDLDLIDRAALQPDYRVRLEPAEYAPGGPFAAAGQWLSEHAARFGFFRPYRGERSGVSAEPWHYSFAPVAEGARRRLTPQLAGTVLQAAALEGRETVLALLTQLHARYFDAIDPP